MTNEEIKKKFDNINLGTTPLYILIDNDYNTYSLKQDSGYLIYMFPNKLDAVLAKLAMNDTSYKICEFISSNPVVRILKSQMESGKLKPLIVWGYRTARENDEVKFIISDNGKPTFKSLAIPFENIKDGLELKEYFMEYVLDNDYEIETIVERFKASNSCSDTKLEAEARKIIEQARLHGVFNAKKEYNRHIFAVNNDF